MNDLVIVHSWPESAHLALDELRSDRALTAISVAAADTTIRRGAKEHIRAALRAMLGALLHRPAASISLVSHPGRPLLANLPGRHIRLSVSYAAGYVVAAISLRCAVGIDVMRVEEAADAMPDWENVAQDYLGMQACARIARLAPEQRSQAFAQEWTRFEAGLKCHGLALTEWCPRLEHLLASCSLLPLALPKKMTGAIARLDCRVASTFYRGGGHGFGRTGASPCHFGAGTEPL